MEGAGVVKQNVHLSADGKLLSVHIPMQFRRRGGKKMLIAPVGTPQLPQSKLEERRTAKHSGIDAKLVKAVVQAYRWQRNLEEGRYATVGDLAKAEKLDKSLVARTLRLTLLAPDIIEAILDGRQSDAVQCQRLLHGFPLSWEEQRIFAAD